METEDSPASLDDVRLAIFRQHTQLAQVLDELETSANAVLDKGGNGEALRRALDALQARFLRHLAFEEANLSHKEVLGDHAEQRVRLQALVHDRDVYGDATGLAREARAFVHALRKDLADENEKLRALA
jgi:hypothetical protein